MFWELLPWLLVCLAVATPSIALAEWLIGDEGVIQVRNRLADWYVYVEDGDWSTLISSSARQTEGFLSGLLGQGLISARSVLVWLAISSSVSLTAFSVNHIVRYFGIRNAIGGVAGTFVVDFAFLVLGRILLRRMAAAANTRFALAFLGYAFVASYFGIGLLIAAGD